MQRAVWTVALLFGVVGSAAADDSRGEPSLTARARGAVTTAAEGARAGAERVKQAAAEKAGEVAESAGQRAREAADAAGARARDAAEYGKGFAERIADGAGDQVSALGERMASVLDKSKELAAATLQAARDGTRALLVGAADAIDESTAAARKAERRAHWEKLKARFRFEGDRPSPAVSDELREHQYRVARLERAREVAEAADDARAVKRSDRLLEAEHGRHYERLRTLREEQRLADEREP